MRKSLILLVSALLLSTAVFSATEVHAQAGIGGSESGTWVVMRPHGPHQTVIRPSGRIDTIIYPDSGYGGYGQPGIADYYDYYNYQLNGAYQAGYSLGRGLRLLFGND